MRSLRRISQVVFGWKGLVLFVGILTSTVARGDGVDEQWLVDPPQLFAVPVARPIPAFDLHLSSYSTFATDAHHVRTTAILGLTGLAQVEVTNVRVLSELESSRRTVENFPSAALKVYLPFGKVGWWIPDVAAVARRTFPGPEKRALAYRQQTGELYLVGSWNLFGAGRKPSGWRGMDVHVGMSLIGARVIPANPEAKDETTHQTTTNEEPMATPTKNIETPLVSNEWMPFGGIEVWLTRRAEVLAEVQWVPALNASQSGIETVWSARSGMRFFFTPYLSVDVGGLYQENFETIADTNFEARVSFTVPIHRLYRTRQP